MRRWRAWTALVLVVGGLWALAGWCLHAASRTPDGLESKLSQSTRVLFYRVDPQRPLRFPLVAQTRHLRLATLLQLPDATPYDPERHVDYGLKLRLVREGQPPWERALYARSHQSKALRIGDRWLKENTFTTTPAEQFADRRDFDVELPPDAPAATLEVAPADPQSRVLVRVLAPDTAMHSGRPFHVVPLPLPEENERAEAVTYVPWEMLRAGERASLADEQWVAVAPDGEGGTDYVPQVVRYTGFRLPGVGQQEPDGWVVRAERHIAINVEEATTFRLMLRPGRPESQAGAARKPVTLEVQSVGEGPQPGPWTFALDAQAPSVVYQFDVPHGMRSLHFTTQDEDGVQVRLWAVTEASKPTALLLPATRLVETFVADASPEPLQFDLGEPLDLAARTLRFEARAIAPEEGPADLRVTVLDAKGKESLQQLVPVRAPYAPFECATADLQRASAVECARAAPEGVRTVSEPFSFRFILPADGRFVRVAATRPVALSTQVAAQLPAPPAVFESPYDQLKSETITWRYAPLAVHGWHALRPVNHAALSQAGRRLRIVAQQRLEYVAPAVSDPSAFPLEPLGAAERQPVLEQIAPERRAQTLARWDAASYTALRPNSPLALRFDARQVSRPLVRYWLADVAADALGDALQLSIDDRSQSLLLATLRGEAFLPPVEPGTHTVEARGMSDTEARLFVNRPPVSLAGAELYRVRTLHSLGNKPITVTVHKPGRELVTVFAVVYTPASRAGAEERVRVRIDGGSPQRRAGVAVQKISLADREVRLPALAGGRAVFMNRSAPGPFVARTVALTLGEDIAPGTHEIAIERRTEGELWFRFFTRTPNGTPAPSATGWTTEGWRQDAPADGEEP